MAGKSNYNELERKNRQLENEVLEYIRKAKELSKKRKVTDRSHIRRAISLMHINEELNRELKELRRSDNLISAVAENIAKIIEREEAEADIRKHQDHIEALIKKTGR